ncbi:unnamed protein product [Mucor hiemalis]
MNTPNNEEENNFQHIRWNAHYTVESTPKDLDNGDKIVLPASALEQLLLQAGSSGNLPSPLTFELRHPHTGAIRHCGVKEFSSESTILPKGTWTRLQPLSADYRDITDYRAALEAHLRGHYTTLTKGQILTCRYGGRAYEFQLSDLKPKDAVSITDTDLEVDMEPIITSADAIVKDQANSSTAISKKLAIIELNTSISEVEVPKGSYKYWKLVINDVQDVALKITVESGNADIVVSSTDRTPTLENHEWCDLTSDRDRFVQLSHITSSHLHVGVHGYTENTVVSWEAAQSTTLATNQMMDLDEEDHEGKVQCKNCHSWVLERTLLLHEGFCLRNNVICPWGCGKVFKKGSEEYEHHWHCDQCEYVGDNSVKEREKHTAYYHTTKKCVCTTFETNSFQALAEHRRSTCPEKLITCRYCHILVAQGVVSLDARDRLLGLHSHESYCGSRTIVCQKCNKPITIKEIQVHAKIHEVKRQQQTLPPMCCNRNCIRPRANKNRLSFCQYCFGPFWITEDDPKNVKLIQRVVRKSHSQLTVGCGNGWCRNKHCATATKEPKDATTAASLLIPMIKSLPRELALSNPNPELYFCVDEATTRKKFLAELLASESEGKYELGWCVRAIESEQEDLDRAKTWLDNHAPRKNHAL